MGAEPSEVDSGSGEQTGQRAQDPPAETVDPTTPQVDPFIQQKASAYDFLMSDPQFSQTITEMLSVRLGESPRQTTPPMADPNTNSNPDFVSRAEYNQLVETVKSAARILAEDRLRSYRQSNPDFTGDIERRAAENIRKYPGMTLEDAHRLASVQGNGAHLARQQQSAVAPTESGPGGGGVRSPGVPDPIREVQAKIAALPQSPTRTEDAFKLAYEAAKRVHSVG